MQQRLAVRVILFDRFLKCKWGVPPMRKTYGKGGEGRESGEVGWLRTELTIDAIGGSLRFLGLH